MNLLYEQNNFPIFQNRLYTTANDAIHCPKGDIRLVEDIQTGLIFNAAFKAELMIYDGLYQNEQAISPTFQQYLYTVANIIDKTIGRKGLVEEGCGKGFFLELLLGKGFDVIGFDPAYEGSNPKIRQQYFTHEMTYPAQGFILRHVLEHIEKPIDFLDQLRKSNCNKGNIYIEVPCFDWICKHKAWFDIFYEHVNYFRISDFKNFFGKIIDIGKLFGGQYLYVVAELASLKEPIFDIKNRIFFPKDFSKFWIKKIPKNHITVWGGSSKGVIFSLFMQRSGFSVTKVIDINPAKQGYYLPGTGLRVLSPKEAMEIIPEGSIIYIMNPNYTEEIKKISMNKYIYEEIAND